MKNLSAILILICTSLIGITVGNAQETSSLFGKVRGEDHKSDPPADWKATVYAVVAGKSGDPIRTESTEDVYVIPVPTNARVTVWFHSTGYIPKDLLPPLNTGTKPTLPVRPSPVVLTKPKGNGLLATQAGRRMVLDKIAEFGRETRAIDLVMYDLGVIRAEVGNNAEAVADIDRVAAEIKSDTIFQGRITPEHEKMWLMFNKVIERNVGKPIEIDPDSLLDLIKQTDLPYGVRYEAVRALTKLDLSPERKEQSLSYFRQQRNTDSSLLIPATYALATLGTVADKLSVVRDVTSTDSEKAVAAIAAIASAKLTSGVSALAGIAESGTVEAAVRIEAIESLDILAGTRETTAVGSLTRILEEQKNPEQVRIEAAEALRDLELSANERRRIEKVANQDPSINVRTAATGAGKVKPISPAIRP